MKLKNNILKLFILIFISILFVSCNSNQEKIISDKNSSLQINNISNVTNEINSKTNSLELIINDMKLIADSKPHGVPDDFDWVQGSSVHHLEEVDPKILNKYHAMTAWGQAYFSRESNYVENIRVQIKDIKAYVLKKSDMKWHRIQFYPNVIGSAYPEDFQGSSESIDLRNEPSGGISAKLQEGRNFHFFPSQRAAFDPNDDIAVFTTFQGRLILDNSNLEDNRDKAKILANAGADPWETLSNDIGPSGIQPELGVGRFKYLTKDWQSFNMITLTENQTRQSPPPIN